MKPILPLVTFLLAMLALPLCAQNIPAPALLCVTTNEQTGNVDITWSAPALDPCGPFVQYVLQGATNIAGPYNQVALINSYSTTTYNHVGANATIVNWFYRIFMVQNCPGSVSDTSAILAEEVLYTPTINYITVLPSGGVQINWQQSPNAAPQGFVILYIDPATGLGIRIDSVLGSTATTFIDQTQNPTASPVVYEVKAFNACGNETANNPTHTTIFLDATVDPCAQEVLLSFNPYRNWPGDTVANYRLEVVIDGAAPQVVNLGNNYPPSAPGVRYEYVYDIAGLSGDSIQFTLVAEHPNGTYESASNVLTAQLNALQSISFVMVWNATVNRDSTISVSWIADSTADISKFVIFRGTDPTALAPIDSFTTTLGSIPFLQTYIDTTVDVNANSWYYKVLARDTCGFSLSSDPVRTIFLTAELVGGFNELNWNNYEQTNAFLLNTSVFRAHGTTLVPIETVLPSVNNYQDPVESAITTDGTFCYVVQSEYQLVVPSMGISRGLETYSQVACVDLPPKIFIPNAFVPDGSNKTFKPVLLFPAKEYSFRIFDRWGKELFYTENIIAGWTGAFNGERLPFGGYVYVVRAVSQAGEVVEKKGVVVLVR
ncbi:hypothetical protein BH09BAC1_BH09BAC1_19100 [soil metagenome]